MLRWSRNVLKTYKPVLLAPEEVGSLRDRAYPFADTVGVRVDIDFDQTAPPSIIVTPTSVTFLGQQGPIKEVGINGCQVDDIITFALGTIKTFNKKFPCRENSLAITKLQEALMWLDARRQDRETRGVEGKDEE